MIMLSIGNRRCDPHHAHQGNGSRIDSSTQNQLLSLPGTTCVTVPGVVKSALRQEPHD